MGYYVEVEAGIRAFVEEVGTGRPVVFLHGWPQNHQLFEYQFNELPKHGFRCIGIDFRGFGKSDRPWHGYSYDRLADDVRVIVEALQLKNAALIGFSMGGAVAIRYMARYGGDRINQLLLLAAAAPSFTQREGFPYGMKKEEVNAIIDAAYKDRPNMANDFGRMFFASQISDSFRSWVNDQAFEASSQGTIKCAESLRDEDLRPDLAKIQVPTTIFHGALDRICPYALAMAMHEGIANSKLIRFERSGHGVFYDELAKFNQELLTSLNQVRYRIGNAGFVR
ncbi:alpha/beta fold hydrolase [Paenibacillus rigui]|uniref:Alpha/beta hydrolase n=1 Tax=Paenibacillus rigui TaxID=554312 RepID=A0A229ULR7_9BACL|nr:alpha/beta hydrolase [Paenibacillus rigui]OXM84417.1 alpha/beta hydrolase [Paenibacillus rigui]